MAKDGATLRTGAVASGVRAGGAAGAGRAQRLAGTGGCWRCFASGNACLCPGRVDPWPGVAGAGAVAWWGCRLARPVVASPLYKQRYALMDGRCLDDPALSVACWPGATGRRQVWVQLE